MTTGCCNTGGFQERTLLACTIHSAGTVKYLGGHQMKFQVKPGSQDDRAHRYLTADRQSWTWRGADTPANILPVHRSNRSFHTTLFLKYGSSTSTATPATLGPLSRRCGHAPAPRNLAVKPWRWLSCYQMCLARQSGRIRHWCFLPLVGVVNAMAQDHFLKARAFRNKSRR